jgi:hypothetical protein
MDVCIILHATGLLELVDKKQLKEMMRSQFKQIFDDTPQMKIAFSGFDIEVRE